MFQIARALSVRGMRAASSTSVVPKGTNGMVRVSGKLGRSSKQHCREFELAAGFYKEGKRNSLRKLKTIVTKQKEENEATSRCAAFAAALALKLLKAAVRGVSIVLSSD